MQELWFLHFDICMKFHKDSLNGFQVIVRTRLTSFDDRQSSKGNNSKSINARY